MLLQWKSNKEGRPYIIRIPLEDEDDGEEGESAYVSFIIMFSSFYFKFNFIFFLL